MRWSGVRVPPWEPNSVSMLARQKANRLGAVADVKQQDRTISWVISSMAERQPPKLLTRVRFLDGPPNYGTTDW